MHHNSGQSNSYARPAGLIELYSLLAFALVLGLPCTLRGQQAPHAAQRALAQQSADSAPSSSPRQAELESALAKMLSGATLEGSFTSTGAGRDPTKLSREKYTLGEVKKVHGNIWLIPARIQYGEHDVTLPIPVPIHWAGDTPVIVVDNVTLPGFGTVSARVMFFADHYAGYWKHGSHGGHLFGVIRRDDQPDAPRPAPAADPSASSLDSAAGQQNKE
jgi:hypothetical protein